MKIFKAKPLHRYSLRDLQIEFIDSFFCEFERPEPGFNLRMFNQDFANLFLHKSHNEESYFEVSTSNKTLFEDLLSSLTSSSSRSTDRKISKYLEEVAAMLINHNRAYYFLENDVELDVPRIFGFPSGNLIHIFGKTLQWIPKRLEKHWDRPSKVLSREIRILDENKIISFSFPASIKAILGEQNRVLKTLDRHKYSTQDYLTQATHENPSPSTNFNFKVWNEIQDTALYKATKGTGWKGRIYNNNKCSDFFECHRLIRLRRNQVILRDDLLKQLSQELTKVGKTYEPNFNVIVNATSALPTLTRLNELEVQLQSERVSFREVIDFCFNL